MKRMFKWRASFKPNAYLIGSKRRPESIVLYGVTGGAERWLRIPLDLMKPSLTYAVQALAFVRKNPLVPFWGDTTGYVINYSSNFVVVFDVSGNPIEILREGVCAGAGSDRNWKSQDDGEAQRLICSTRRAGNF